MLVISSAFGSWPWSRDGQIQLGRGSHPFEQRLSSQARKSSIAAVGHKRLEPNDAAFGQFAQAIEVSLGCETTPERKVGEGVLLWPQQVSSRSSRGRVSVATSYNGMSKNIAPPPAASAAEPVAIPSQCARPGSLK